MKNSNDFIECLNGTFNIKKLNIVRLFPLGITLDGIYLQTIEYISGKQHELQYKCIGDVEIVNGKNFIIKHKYPVTLEDYCNNDDDMDDGY